MFEYYERIYAYVRRRVAPIEEVEDVTQRTFMKAWDKRHTLRDESRASSWLHTIARNECNVYWRREFARRRTLDSLYERALDCTNDDTCVIEREGIERVRELLSGLTERQQTLVHLRFTDELSSSQMGERLGISATGVRVQLHRAIENVRRRASENV